MRHHKRNNICKHHLKPISKGGAGCPSNILMIYRDRHDLWHRMFGLLNLQQTIALLQRVARIKGAL